MVDVLDLGDLVRHEVELLQIDEHLGGVKVKRGHFLVGLGKIRQASIHHHLPDPVTLCVVTTEVLSFHLSRALTGGLAFSGGRSDHSVPPQDEYVVHEDKTS